MGEQSPAVARRHVPRSGLNWVGSASRKQPGWQWALCSGSVTTSRLCVALAVGGRVGLRAIVEWGVNPAPVIGGLESGRAARAGRAQKKSRV